MVICTQELERNKLRYSILEACVACGSKSLIEVLDLGNQPLANELKENLTSESHNYPLVLNRCSICYHCQLSISVNPNILFSHYLYESGTTQTLREYFNNFVSKYVSIRGSELKVLDIASNDGTFLSEVKKHGHKVLGIDPAANLLGKALASDINTVCAYWPSEIGNFLQKVDVIVAMYVLAHVPDPLRFLVACKELLSDNGVILVQTSQAKMIEMGQFDTMYHEHISFFNTKSMQSLANRAGLNLASVSYENIHGISYVWEMVNKNERISETDPIFEHEMKIGLFADPIYEDFKNFSKTLISQVQLVLETERSAGLKIIGYGAAAKGNTFICHAGLHLDFMVDDNLLKQGMFTPQTNFEIRAPSVLQSISEPICFLVPAWNFVSEISSKIRLIRDPKMHELDQIVTYFPKLIQRSLAEVM